ncbi:MAG: transposase [Lysobacteraceae bacterium]|nr:MAG: transposase [Xanthomonadaceae bacterium]
MRTWKRLYRPGGTYFFTVVTARREPWFGDPMHVQCLRYALRETRASHPFAMVAFVILPDHLHCIWTLPDHEHDFSLRWALVKKRCKARMIALAPSMRGQPIWQPRFWEHHIRDERDFMRHLDYIHYNPVRHGYAASARDWPWSSFPKFVRGGAYDADWGQVRPASVDGMSAE